MFRYICSGRPAALTSAIRPRQPEPMDLGIAGKRALVLGASRGLGRAVAAALADEGAAVVLAARNRARLETAAAAINARHPQQARSETVDLADEAAVQRLAESLLA